MTTLVPSKLPPDWHRGRDQARAAQTIAGAQKDLVAQRKRSEGLAGMADFGLRGSARVGILTYSFPPPIEDKA